MVGVNEIRIMKLAGGGIVLFSNSLHFTKNLQQII